MAFKGDLEAVVLAVLREGGVHGYEIARRIREMDEGALNAREGKLYPLLHRLETDGFVSATWMPQDGKPPRKVYSLTLAGHRQLESHRQAWRTFADRIESVLLPEETLREAAHG